MADRVSMGHILAIVDGSETALRAARFAIQFAAMHKASLCVLAVVDTEVLKPLLRAGILVEAEAQEFALELEACAGRMLEHVGRLAREAGVGAELILRRGTAHSVVAEEVRRLRIDLVIMGGFSTPMMKQDLCARQRRLIVDELRCPVLLIS